MFAAALAVSITQGHCLTPNLTIELKDGRAKLTVLGVVQSACAVQWTTNLAASGGNWLEFTNFVLSSSSFIIEDPVAVPAQQMFYRVVQTHPAITVSNAQLQDMCSRMVDHLAANNSIPENFKIIASEPDTVTAAEMHHLMTGWLRYYANYDQTAPASVTITGGVQPPPVPGGIEAGTIYLADILAQAQVSANWAEANRTLPNSSVVGATEYATRAMFSVFARTINYYQDQARMPNFATVRVVAAPASWPTNAPSEGLKVAIFSDSGVDLECVQATLNILSTNSGFVPSTIDGASIRSGGLAAFDVVMFPGGSGGGQAEALGQAGCARVEEFVAGGGGFVGTCAGAYLAALGYSEPSSWLDIVDASVLDIDHWARGTGMAQVRILDPSNVIVAGLGETITARYVNGPLLGPGGTAALPDYQQIAVFISDICDNAPPGIMPGTTCMTTSTYQLGRCVLFSFHPELTAGLEQLDVRAVMWAAGKL
jgi:putative intracellular protease/amidase